MYGYEQPALHSDRLSGSHLGREVGLAKHIPPRTTACDACAEFPGGGCQAACFVVRLYNTRCPRVNAGVKWYCAGRSCVACARAAPRRVAQTAE
eukprot:5407240-Prymnesium_polylepis.2